MIISDAGSGSGSGILTKTLTSASVAGRTVRTCDGVFVCLSLCLFVQCCRSLVRHCFRLATSPCSPPTIVYAFHLCRPVMWTTRAEREWLATFCFDYLKVQGTPGQQIQTWLRAKATEFVAQFPARSAESHSSLVKVRDFPMFIPRIVTDPSP